MRGHFFGRNKVFAHMIKSAAVHLPFFAMGAFRQIIRFAQAQIQSNKIK